jgi:hypothetical protein
MVYEQRLDQLSHWDTILRNRARNTTRWDCPDNELDLRVPTSS